MAYDQILVTGVAGFIGSNLLEMLLAEGHRVVGIDNLSMGRRENIAKHLPNPAFEFLQRDITHVDTLADLPATIDCVVHLAAFKIPRYGKAIETLRINYRGTENVLEFARKARCKCVLASTSDVYGRNPTLPFSEEHSDSVIGSSKSPRWAYAVSKLFDEHMAFAYQDAYGVPVVLLRYFGSYGPNQPLSWWGGPPPVFIDAVLKDEPMPVHGDGRQTRSFTYISDAVRATYQAIVRDEANGHVINIGNAEEIAIVDLAKKIKELSGTPGELKIDFVPYESFTGRQYDDVRRRLPDTKLCERLLGVKAEVPLDDGLRRTIEWQSAATRVDTGK